VVYKLMDRLIRGRNLSLGIESEPYPNVFGIYWTCHPELVSGSRQVGSIGEILNRNPACHSLLSHEMLERILGFSFKNLPLLVQFDRETT